MILALRRLFGIVDCNIFSYIYIFETLHCGGHNNVTQFKKQEVLAMFDTSVIVKTKWHAICGRKQLNYFGIITVVFIIRSTYRE